MMTAALKTGCCRRFHIQGTITSRSQLQSLRRRSDTIQRRIVNQDAVLPEVSWLIPSSHHPRHSATLNVVLRHVLPSNLSSRQLMSASWAALAVHLVAVYARTPGVTAPHVVSAPTLGGNKKILSLSAEPLLAEATAGGGVDAPAPAGDDTQTSTEPREPGQAQASNDASLRAGAMLGQMCERALIEHQLAASYFAWHSFCEHAPVAPGP